MTARITAVTDRVVSALQGIRTDGGFRTDAGLRVYRGREPGQFDARKSVYPLIQVRTVGETLKNASSKRVMIDREIEVQGVIHSKAEDYEAELDALAEDIYLAVLPLTAIDATDKVLADFSVGAAGYEHPAQASPIAAVSILLTASYAITTS